MTAVEAGGEEGEGVWLRVAEAMPVRPGAARLRVSHGEELVRSGRSYELGRA